MNSLIKTNYSFPGQTNFYRGKVRDVYTVNDKLIMIATDRISAFDVVLPKGIPYKGQILNQIASKFLDLTADIVPNWKLASPDPMVTIGLKCKPFPVEMIIRAYLTGSSWRTYSKGQHTICGIKIPEGMKENQKFDKPIITPTTKAEEGHDQDISKKEIIEQGLVSAEDYKLLEEYTYKLFERGAEYAAKRGLILVDTKYEFGKIGNKIYLIDEVHTPDSSRYFFADEYQKRFANGQKQRQLSKEFVRQWLMDNGFMGRPNDIMPQMSDEFVNNVTNRYIELYETITGEKFEKLPLDNIEKRIETNILNWLKNS
jgi:phosphoribosylaminoimidazole-succinocarboxamide synthase